MFRFYTPENWSKLIKETLEQVAECVQNYMFKVTCWKLTTETLEQGVEYV